MKYYIISALYCVAVCLADKLNNVYLPPSNSITAGGNGNFLRAPISQGSIKSGSQFSSGSYQTSQQRNVYVNQQQSSSNNFASGSVQPQIAILRFNNQNEGDGTYRFEYETENKIAQQEVGQLKNAGTDQESSVVQGSYSYVGLDGQTYTVNYVADELGFRATGDHLPVAPEIPAEIQKALEQNAADEARGIVDDGQYRPGPSREINSAQVDRKYLTPKVPGAYQQVKQGYVY
ncbi:endocuticle structural glycoprotein SgAbd-2-like [Coccinella septempunctata]|uniref:endocuticle structural glycoprotein SgAbd-2-like n=1 Tax=Coccinella septempunctata TaxID=41139 RepID=UPI001D06C107|nr:endocuticle structural glycoprotein SgAbd-2-like [Coccinella septempunctata]